MYPVRRTLIAFVTLALILLLAAPVAAGPLSRQDEPITLYSFAGVNLNLSLDPQMSLDNESNLFVENLFLGLTDVDFDTNTISPELATAWTVSGDGLVWTFTLRDDVPWVRWNAAAGEDEVLRMVTAHDAAYGIQRACDPRLEGDGLFIAANIIAGCDQLARMAPEEVTDDDYERVQVRALDDVTLAITLQFPAGYFLSMAHLPMFRPVPREIIEEFGADWTTLEHLVTNGAFMLAEFVPDARAIARRNHALPDDLHGPGNVERVILTPGADIDAMFAFYEAGQVDGTGVPSQLIDTIVNNPQYADQFHRQYIPTVWYLGFAHDKAPFDNVHVRRAFAAMIDRAYFWGEVVPYVGVPMRHITPPGIFGAPPLDDVGIAFDADYAREQLALGGYPNCEGLPPVEIATFTAERFMAFIVASAESVLGCNPDLLTVNVMDFGDLVGRTDPALPPEARPHLWFAAWAADYPDANNYVQDLLGCTADNPFQRSCGPVDDLIDQARRETDILTRVALYRDVEERFFGPDGVFPVIPVMLLASYELHQPWITLFKGVASTWDRIAIDQAMQLAARGGADAGD